MTRGRVRNGPPAVEAAATGLEPCRSAEMVISARPEVDIATHHEGDHHHGMGSILSGAETMGVLLLLGNVAILAAGWPGRNRPAEPAQPDSSVESLPVLELRQYTLLPGKRDVLIELFEREFIEAQEATGMTVVGQFRDLDRSDRFVWFRAFPDMPTRARALTAFYDGPAWREHRGAANATLIDSDNVLLLRPARPNSGFATSAQPRPPRGATGEPASLVAAAIYSFDEAADAGIVELFERDLRPLLERGGGTVLGYFVTDRRPNNFPRLPVRQGETVFVWLASFQDGKAYDAVVSTSEWRQAAQALSRRLKAPPEVLRLAPTPRSLLGSRK